MAYFVPFSAVHFNPNKFSKITELVCPPFDTINSALKKELMEEHYNFAHLILPEGDAVNKYKAGVHKLFGWLLRDVLVVDSSPALYIHEQTIEMESMVYKRMGVIGLMKIEEYSENVKKHEKSNQKIVDDRYAILKETQSNLESIFCLYKDEKKELPQMLKASISNIPVMLEFVDDENIINKIYKIDNLEVIQSINLFLNNKSIYIAEGHHRYEAALKYQKEMKDNLGSKYTGKEPFNFIMTDLFNAYDSAMIVRPYNRLIKRCEKNSVDILRELENNYKIGAINFQDLKMEKLARNKIRSLIAENRVKNLASFGVYFKNSPNRYFLLTSKKLLEANDWDVDILDKTIIKPVLGIGPDNEEMISYESNDNQTYELVKSGEYSMAFIQNPFSIQKILEISDNNMVLPNKSTQFYPKVLSGISIFSYRYSTIKLL